MDLFASGKKMNMKRILMLGVMVVMLNITLRSISAETANAAVPIQGRTGIIKSYNEKKKFGFIKDDESGKQIYFNEDGLIDKPVYQGDKVIYEVIDGRSGLKAINIKKV